MTKIETKSNCLKTDIKGALEGVFMADLEKWNKEQMVENQVFKRKIKFKTWLKFFNGLDTLGLGLGIDAQHNNGQAELR